MTLKIALNLTFNMAFNLKLTFNMTLNSDPNLCDHSKWDRSHLYCVQWTNFTTGTNEQNLDQVWIGNTNFMLQKRGKTVNQAWVRRTSTHTHV